MNTSFFLFSGSSHPALAKKIAELAGISFGGIKRQTFPDHELFVEILERVWNKDTFIVQSLAFRPNDYLVELLLIADALKRGGAASITAIVPYYGYARQDRMDQPGVAIAAKLVANLMVAAGISRLICMDLHSEQIEGFFDIPVEQVLSRTLLIPYCRTLNLENCMVVAPDKGGIKIAGAYAKELHIPMALIDKERINPFEVETHLFIGSVKGHTVLLPDDMCSTGGTLISAAKACAELGAKSIIALIGHGLFMDDALKNIHQSPIDHLITTDSIPLHEEIYAHPKIHVLSMASLFANACRVVVNH